MKISIFVLYFFTVLIGSETRLDAVLTKQHLSEENAEVQFQNLETDICIFSFNRPMQLYACLESLQKLMKDVHCINVIYRVSSTSFNKGYEIVKAAFPNVRYFKQSPNPHADFKPLLLDIVYGNQSTEASSISFCVDDLLIKDSFSLKECTKALQQTGAYGFFLRLGQSTDYCYALSAPQGVPSLETVTSEILSWEFASANGDWGYPNSVDMTIYPKHEIKEALFNLEYIHPNSFEGEWAGHANLYRKGLCFQESKVVNIPDNLVNVSSWVNKNMNAHTPQELLSLFLRGLKIDISTVYQIKNRSAHIDHQFSFIPRV